MIAGSSALSLLVALSLAVSPGDPSACAADDLQCSASAYAAAARRASSDAERVEYLYFASRAYLALAKKSPGSPSTRELCKAKRLIDQALALPTTELRERLVESRRSTLSRISEQQVECRRPREPRKVLPPINPVETDPPELLAPVPATDPPPVSPTVDPPNEVATQDVVRRPVAEITVQPPSPRTDTKGSSVDPGRPLQIGGGVALAAGLALTGVAAYAGARTLDARRTGHASEDLPATPENLLRNSQLEHDYRRFGPAAIVTGVAGGAAVVAAIVMLAVGTRRKARAADGEPILMPVRTGLLFTFKF